jgi:dihydrodipicolinate synthase/N-acetylneuraminate lyase
MAKFFRGIISEPMISYHADQSIDFETTEKIFRNLAQRGAGGLFVNGSATSVIPFPGRAA